MQGSLPKGEQMFNPEGAFRPGRSEDTEAWLTSIPAN
jgi:hypothetical protein